MKYKEVNDDSTAGSPWFYVETYRTFQNGLKMLLDEIIKFDTIVKELDLSESPYEYDKNRIKQMIDYLKDELNKKSDYDTVVISGASYGSLRYLKAGIMMLVQQLEDKKDKLIQEHDFLPVAVIESIDAKITILKNKAETGLLNGLKPANIFFDIKKIRESDRQKQHNKGEKINQMLPLEKIVLKTENLQILDDELRKRCLRLLKGDDFENQLDTVVREMSVILEDRIRKRAEIKDKATGPTLMSRAFSGDNPILSFSDDKDLQESAHLLYRGYSGFVRNEVMHKIVTTFTKERVIQLLGFVDYLLFLLTQAKKNKIKKP